MWETPFGVVCVCRIESQLLLHQRETGIWRCFEGQNGLEKYLVEFDTGMSGISQILDASEMYF